MDPHTYLYPYCAWVYPMGLWGLKGCSGLDFRALHQLRAWPWTIPYDIESWGSVVILAVRLCGGVPSGLLGVRVAYMHNYEVFTPTYNSMIQFGYRYGGGLLHLCQSVWLHFTFVCSVGVMGIFWPCLFLDLGLFYLVCCSYIFFIFYTDIVPLNRPIMPIGCYFLVLTSYIFHHRIV